jgi:hypothetical protein
LDAVCRSTVDSQLGLNHRLDIPQQGLLGADIIYYGAAQTYWGSRFGVDVLDKSGWRFGLNGYYKQSSEASLLGARAYVLVPTSLADWLFVNVAPR